MKYAKLIEGYPAFAPNPIKYNGRRVANPPKDVLLFLGYLPVRQDPYPEQDPPEGYYWSPVWAQVSGWIVQSWEAVPVEEEE